MMKKIFATLAIGATLALASCNHNDSPEDTRTYYTDFATVDGISQAGTTFTLQKLNDSPMVTLTSMIKIDEKVPVGTRLLIQYVPESGEQYKSGPIDLLTAMQIFGGGAAPKDSIPTPQTDWEGSSIRVSNLYRTGEYLNFMVLGQGILNKLTFCVDANTIDTEMPDIYLTADIIPALGSNNYAQMFGSYSIKKLWDKETTKGVRVHFNDPMVSKGYHDFLKDAQEDIKPAE